MAHPPAYKNLGTTQTPGQHKIIGRFTTKDGDAPTVLEGAGFTVGAPATAVYTLTGTPAGQGKYAGWVSFRAWLVENLTSSTKEARALAVTISTDPWTATIVTQSTAGTAATLSGPIVCFELVMRNTEATK